MTNVNFKNEDRELRAHVNFEYTQKGQPYLGVCEITDANTGEIIEETEKTRAQILSALYGLGRGYWNVSIDREGAENKRDRFAA